MRPLCGLMMKPKEQHHLSVNETAQFADGLPLYDAI
ncbi:hypothetical protein DXJ85_11685 [Vibrio parahaemolyticus]|nr:hypothetical protein DXJ85_11685 [Vibrio parahaemolyticus]